ncbi:MAG TPA: NAD(P)-binding domain-containing protein [Candidatus Paceibacterota bacterium]|nr:NAD(P)-binding domain-containing protein [Candidatus Paceibacterota bacterium]
MSTKQIGFVGGGRITRIFLDGWKRANALPANIVVSDCSAEPLARLKARFPAINTVQGSGAAASQDLVFLAVHPPVMAEVASAIKGSLKPGTLAVSLAPKFTISKLTELLGGFARLARVIPNAPSVVNVGFNPVAFGPALTVADKAELTGLLTPLGECPEVAEEKLEAYALLTGMGPTYLWFQLQALREVAAGFGLSEVEITPALKRMVCGSARTLLESGLTPTEVMDLIPVKPLAEMEPQVAEMYRTRLPGLYQKIKP